MEARREHGAARGSQAGPVVTRRCLRAASGRERRKCLNSCGERHRRPGPRRAALATSQATGGSRPPFCSLNQSLAPPASILLVRLWGDSALLGTGEPGLTCRDAVAVGGSPVGTRKVARGGAATWKQARPQPRCQEVPRKATRLPGGPGGRRVWPRREDGDEAAACVRLTGWHRC